MEKYLKGLIEFLNKSYSSFHVIYNVKELLTKNGFEELKEEKGFKLEKGHKYFVTRNGSSIIAFNIGSDIKDYSFNIVASHSDSPTFKVMPNSDLSSSHYLRVSTEGYGGMICSTWLDRPLSIAGRVSVKTKEGVNIKLVNFDKDLCIIPNVCIHFNRDVNDGYKFNKAVDTIPLLGEDDKLTFKEILAKEVGVEEKNILGHDLYLYNRDKAKLVGYNNEFICAPRLDDLECAYSSLVSLIETKKESNINVLYISDNEEVGSLTRQGAASTFLKDILSRVVHCLGGNKEDYKKAIASSFLVSADNAHAVHPNHPEYSDKLNQSFMNEGIVIKSNASQSYTTDGISSSIFKAICDSHNVKTQYFTNRADLRGGSTLGNISNSQVSLMSIDIGLAQLAMHSSNETAGSNDVKTLIKGLKSFYSTSIKIDGDSFLLK